MEYITDTELRFAVALHPCPCTLNLCPCLAPFPVPLCTQWVPVELDPANPKHTGRWDEPTGSCVDMVRVCVGGGGEML